MSEGKPHPTRLPDEDDKGDCSDIGSSDGEEPRAVKKSPKRKRNNNRNAGNKASGKGSVALAESVCSDTSDPSKVQARREANRLHALKSRQRNKQMLTDLQRAAEQMGRDKAELERQNAVLRAQMEVLQQQNVALMQSHQHLLSQRSSGQQEGDQKTPATERVQGSSTHTNSTMPSAQPEAQAGQTGLQPTPTPQYDAQSQHQQFPAALTQLVSGNSAPVPGAGVGSMGPSFGVGGLGGSGGSGAADLAASALLGGGGGGVGGAGGQGEGTLAGATAAAMYNPMAAVNANNLMNFMMATAAGNPLMAAAASNAQQNMQFQQQLQFQLQLQQQLYQQQQNQQQQYQQQQQQHQQHQQQQQHQQHFLMQSGLAQLPQVTSASQQQQAHHQDLGFQNSQTAQQHVENPSNRNMSNNFASGFVSLLADSASASGNPNTAANHGSESNFRLPGGAFGGGREGGV